MQFKQSDSHVNQIGLSARSHGGVYDFIELWIFNFNQVKPSNVNIVERLGVLELRTCCLGTYRSGVIGVGIEGRV